MATDYPTFELGFLGDFEDLDDVSEVVAERHQKRRKINKAKVRPVKTTRATCTCSRKVLPVNLTRAPAPARAPTRAEFAILSVQKKRLFSVKNVLLCYKSNGQCLACVHPIRDALG